jgi:hypothetical protein
MFEYLYSKYIVDLNILTDQINGNITSLNCTIFNSPNDLKIYFNRELTQNEKSILDSIVNLHPPQIGEKNHLVEEYSSSQKVKEIWYNSYENGQYTGKVEETTYSYNGSKLISRTTKTFFLDGTVDTSEDFNYYNDTSNKTIIMRKI